MHTLSTRGLLLGASLSILTFGQTSIQWISLSSSGVEVDGLPWFAENGGELFRLPVKQKDSYRKPVWELAQSATGGRIRLRTNSAHRAIRLDYPEPPGLYKLNACDNDDVDHVISV